MTGRFYHYFPIMVLCALFGLAVMYGASLLDGQPFFMASKLLGLGLGAFLGLSLAWRYRP